MSTAGMGHAAAVFGVYGSFGCTNSGVETVADVVQVLVEVGHVVAALDCVIQHLGAPCRHRRIAGRVCVYHDKSAVVGRHPHNRAFVTLVGHFGHEDARHCESSPCQKRRYGKAQRSTKKMRNTLSPPGHHCLARVAQCRRRTRRVLQAGLVLELQNGRCTSPTSPTAVQKKRQDRPETAAGQCHGQRQARNQVSALPERQRHRRVKHAWLCIVVPEARDGGHHGGDRR